MANNPNRSYDVCMPIELAQIVAVRRVLPDGYLHPVQKDEISGGEIYRYPWMSMELGDYFVAPHANRSPNSMRIAFFQMAARQDWEIAVTPVTQDGQPAWRVCLILKEVSKWKKSLDLLLDEDEAKPEGERLFPYLKRPRYSELTNRAKARAKDAKRPSKNPKTKASTKTVKASKVDGKRVSVPRKKKDDIWVEEPAGAFWVDEAPPPPPPAPAPEVKLTREEIVRRALEGS